MEMLGRGEFEHLVETIGAEAVRLVEEEVEEPDELGMTTGETIEGWSTCTRMSSSRWTKRACS